MGNKNNPIQFGQMKLTDRVAIEVGIAKKSCADAVAGSTDVKVKKLQCRTVLLSELFSRIYDMEQEFCMELDNSNVACFTERLGYSVSFCTEVQQNDKQNVNVACTLKVRKYRSWREFYYGDCKAPSNHAAMSYKGSKAS